MTTEDAIIKIAMELQEAMLHAGISNVDPTDVERIGERQFWLITEALEKAAALAPAPEAGARLNELEARNAMMLGMLDGVLKVLGETDDHGYVPIAADDRERIVERLEEFLSTKPHMNYGGEKHGR